MHAFEASRDCRGWCFTVVLLVFICPYLFGVGSTVLKSVCIRVVARFFVSVCSSLLL